MTSEIVDRLHAALASRCTIERELGNGGMAMDAQRAPVNPDPSSVVPVRQALPTTSDEALRRLCVSLVGIRGTDGDHCSGTRAVLVTPGDGLYGTVLMKRWAMLSTIGQGGRP